MTQIPAITFILIDLNSLRLHKENQSLNNGKLADVAPTILALLGIEQPEIMTGKNLLILEPSKQI